MELIVDSPIQIGWRLWQMSPGRPSLIVVVKVTWAMQKGDACRLAEEQTLCAGDVYHDDDEELSLRTENDFALIKPRGECFVVGSCFVARGRKATQMEAGFSIGPIHKGFIVVGDRLWQNGLGGGISPPRPFTAMPLRPERAFGGPGHPVNPWGVGYKGHGDRLPNIEQPGALVTSRRDKPKPVVTTALPMTWPSRLALAGTYDARWRRERWPYLPADFDPEFFMAAPEDQRISGFWTGDETVRLINMHRRHSRFETRLPDRRPRVFLLRDFARGEESFDEVPLALDTITVDTDAETILCLWRGMIDLASEDLDALDYMFLTEEPRASRTPKLALFQRFLQRRREEEGETDVEREQRLDEAKTTLYRPDGATIEMEADDATIRMAPEVAEEDSEMAAAEARLDAALAGQPAPPPLPEPQIPDPASIAATLKSSGMTVPPELLGALEELARSEPDEPEAPPPPPEPTPDELERLLRMLDAGDDLSGETFEGLDLSELDLSGKRLAGISLINVNLTKARLHDAELDGARLEGCTLDDADLTRACLREADLTDVTARRASFADAILDDALLEGGDLSTADFRRASALGASFTAAKLADAIFVGAMLDEADFSDATMPRADFTRAVLANASVQGARAPDVKLDEADLTGFRATDGAVLPRCSARGAHAPESFWDGCNLQDGDFTGAVLDGSFFTSALLFQARLDGSSCRGCTLTGATLSHASLLRADFFQADLESADLSYADFRGANLFGAEVWKATLEGTLFDLANTKRTKIGVLAK